MKLFGCCFGINFLILSISCEFYSSTDSLHDLYYDEVEFLDNFVDVIVQIDDFRDVLSKKLTLWTEEHNAAKDNVEKYVTNPLNAYLLIKRNFYDVKLLQEKLSSFINDLQLKVQLFEENCLKETKEVTGAVTGIIRAQRAYHLKAEDLVEGIIDGAKTRERLTTHDIYVLGVEALKIPNGSFFAKSFLKIVAEKLKNEEDIANEVNSDEVDKLLAELELEDIFDPFDESYTINELRTRKAEDILVHKVCRGNLTRLPNETKNLQCRFVFSSSFSMIAPFKLEEASLEPYVVLYHEIISEKEIETILDLTRPYQERAGVGHEDKEFTINDEDRLAQLAWLFDDDDEVVRRLSLRFEDMTGLNMETAEGLQVQNYGIGGQYYGHYDHDVKETDPGADQRMATLMLYLSDVEKGGATVFPYLKLRIEPRKGSAVFWYNLKHSGQHEPYSLHSGCPMLLGSKWVANVWIHNRGQEFRRQCEPGKFVDGANATKDMLWQFKENSQ